MLVVAERESLKGGKIRGLSKAGLTFAIISQITALLSCSRSFFVGGFWPASLRRRNKSLTI